MVGELSLEVRREKALRYFVSLYGAEAGAKAWDGYCKKTGLLPKPKVIKAAKEK